jgi:hypothetical protein
LIGRVNKLENSSIFEGRRVVFSDFFRIGRPFAISNEFEQMVCRLKVYAPPKWFGFAKTGSRRSIDGPTVWRWPLVPLTHDAKLAPTNIQDAATIGWFIAHFCDQEFSTFQTEVLINNPRLY